MQEFQVFQNWDLKTFQHQLRNLEVLHQDYFGVINLRKYFTKIRTRFHPRTTPIRIQTHTNMEDNFVEYDKRSTFDSENELLQARRQSNAPHEIKRVNFNKSKKGTKNESVFDRHDAKHLLKITYSNKYQKGKNRISQTPRCK